MNKNPETLKMIQELSDAIGPSGFEDEAVNTARKYVEDIARVEEDCLRNLYMYRNTNTGDKPVFMLDATAMKWALWFIPSNQTEPFVL